MMKRYISFVLLVVMTLLPLQPAGAQSVMKRAGEFMRTAIEGTAADSVSQSKVQGDVDSLRMEEMALEIQQMKLNEIMLRSALNAANSRNSAADSLKRVAAMREIDSLRNVTRGVPVVIDEDTLLTLYASLGGRTPADRAERITEAITKIGKDRRISRDSVYTFDNEFYTDIMYGDKVIMSVTDRDALWAGTTRAELADTYSRLLWAKIKYIKNEYSFWQIVKRSVVFVIALLVIYLIFKTVNLLFRRLRRRIIRIKQIKKKGIIIRDYEILNPHNVCRLLIFASNLLRYFILFLVLVITVPVLFSIFPQTEKLAMRIITYIMDPVRTVVKSVIEYIPNIFIIAVIFFCIRYLVKGFRYIAGEIESEKLHIGGFYPEWAQPTFNIIRFLLYAFMIAMIYPYLPGAHSGVFQGISVFVGLIVSLGSSTVISNFIAGFVITYMRPFKKGDFIKVKDTVGNVVEKTPFVTRLRTIKNEIVTIPNSFIMSSDTVNYSASARQYGLIIHTVMTMGYDVPWRKVHDLLIEAALETPEVVADPKPFVLQTELNDNYMCYQINAYIRNADDMPVVTSALLENIQDKFQAAGIDMVAPHFYSDRARMKGSYD